MAAAEFKTKKNENIVGVAGSLENEEDYDPFANRSNELKTSSFGTFVHMVKAATATGVLFLPNAFRRTGYVMAVVCSFLIGFIYTHNCVSLVRCAQTLCRRYRVPQLDFAETVEVSFLSGPERIRAHGRTFGVFTNVIVCYIQYLTVVVYILYVASSFQQVIEFFTDIHLDLRIYVILFFPVVCFMILVPTFHLLTPFSTIGSVFFAVGIAVSFYYFLDHFPNPKRLDAFTNVLSVPMYCTIFLYALHNITMLLPLENTMAKPLLMPRLIGIATLMNTILYTVFGFLGYNKYKESCDTVIKNLPLDEPLAEVVKIGIAISVLFSIGITYLIPVGILWPLIMDKMNLHPNHEITFRLIGIVLATLLAIMIPQMIPLIGLLAAIGMTCSMLLLPMLVEFNTKWKEASFFIYAKSGFIFLLFLLISVMGVILIIILVLDTILTSSRILRHVCIFGFNLQ